MHFEISALIVQSEQAIWVQEYEAALGCCLQRPFEKIFSLLTVTLTIVHFVWFRDFRIPGEISFQNIDKKFFETLNTHCINCYSLETNFLIKKKKFSMTGNYFRRRKRSHYTSQ